MKNKEELIAWIASANAYAPSIPGYNGGKPVSLPLLTGLTLRGDTQDYIANADFIVPNNGDIILRGRLVRFPNVSGSAPLEGAKWTSLREDRSAYKWVIRDLKNNPIKAAVVTPVVPEVPKTTPAPVIPEVPKKDKGTPEGDSVTPKTPGTDLADKPVDAPKDAPKKDEVGDEVEVIAETPNFNSMSKKKIDKWALTQGIEVDGRMSKTDMIAFVEEALAK